MKNVIVIWHNLEIHICNFFIIKIEMDFTIQYLSFSFLLYFFDNNFFTLLSLFLCHYKLLYLILTSSFSLSF